MEERTAELARSNSSMKELLHRQEINIGLASRVLQLVNSAPLRNQPLPGGLNLFVAAHLMPKNKEGGDHFFSRRIGTGAHTRTLVSLKDQSGHEVGCILRSIITDLFHNALLSRGGGTEPLASVITRLNRELCNSHLFGDGEYLTSATLEIHHDTLELHYLLTGPPPFLLVREGKVHLYPGNDRQGANLPLGMIEGAVFQHGTLSLQAGDRILLYTDGLLEVPMSLGKPALTAGELAAHLESLLDTCGAFPITRLCHRLLASLGESDSPFTPRAEPLPDDLSLVVIELETAKMPAEYHLKAADIGELGRKRTELVRHIQADALRHELAIDVSRLSIVLEEALFNAWKHGGGESPEAVITVEQSYGNDLHVDIIDQGPGFDHEAAPDPTAPENRTKPSGRGLFMIRRFSDQANWADRGRRLSVHFAPGPAFAAPKTAASLPHFNLWN